MRREERYKYTIIIPIIAYIILAVCTTIAARSSRVLLFGQTILPVSSLSGVISAFGNTMLALMVVMYKNRGFVVSILLLIVQLPSFLSVIIRQHSLASIPGLFSSLFAALILVIIHQGQLRMEKEQRRLESLFEQTATALVNAIDAKDAYTQGHSSRVAQYSRKLAEMNRKSYEECEEIYYAALLHDVGKIGISEAIITKKGKLTDEEFEAVKQHPALGAQILQSISQFPYLSVAATGHHERYDGKGYPYGLAGKEIPEIARIVAVADAYDAMTSKRSYRDPIPQQIVREEIVKGVGTQFDPEYARLMLRLIDVDTGYKMRESLEVKELVGRNELVVADHRSEVSEGILLTALMTTIGLTVKPEDKSGTGMAPSLILFDSLDEKFHEDERDVKNLNYFEYCEIWLDGRTQMAGARDIKTTITENVVSDIVDDSKYRIEAVRIKDHALIKIYTAKQTIENIIALPDSARFAYLSLTGEHCRIAIDNIDKADKESPANYIPRIAEEISYIDVPSGDVPNVQIDGYRTDSSKGVVIRDGLKITFHTKSLPTARLVWHCPYVLLFCADNGMVHGSNYRELAFVRFDGEAWECDSDCTMSRENKPIDHFIGWDAWKEYNQKGYDATVTYRVQGNKIKIITENAGIDVSCEVVVNDISKLIYTALTGDQVALTDIRIQ